MSHITYVYGYIHETPGTREYNQGVLQEYPFDDIWPLPNIFSCSKSTRGVGIITFGMAFNSLEDDWEVWQPAFERLLAHLKVFCVRGDWERDEFGDMFSFHYICLDGYSKEDKENGKRLWLKVTKDKREGCLQEYSEEIYLRKT